MHQPVGELSGFALSLLLLQCINQLHGREESHPLTVVLNGLNTQGRSNVRLRTTDVGQTSLPPPVVDWQLAA